jgi:CubicO group peptidase (beta-lactamase class C family)
MGVTGDTAESLRHPARPNAVTSDKSSTVRYVDFIKGMVALFRFVENPMRDELDAEFLDILNDPTQTLPSLSVAAVKDGRLVYQGAFGSRWIDNANPSRNRPVDQRTVFRIASISKTMTTLGVMRLLEQSKFDLDADVSEYLGFVLRNPHFPDAKITIRQMLSHTSSLRDAAGYYWTQASGLTLKDVMTPDGKAYAPEMWSDHRPPGAYFQYANLPWGVIGTIMERVTGERFDRLMRRLVLDPLDLAGGFEPNDFPPQQRDNIATLYRKATSVGETYSWNASGPWIVQFDDWVSSQPAPRADDNYAPGTNGTLTGPQGNCRLGPLDLVKVMLMFLDRGEHAGRQFLCEQSIDQMLSAQWQYDEKLDNGNTGGEYDNKPRRAMNAWGLGVTHTLDITGKGIGDRLVEPGGYRATGHFGDAYGLQSGLMFNRESRSGMIYLAGGVSADPATTPGHYSSMARYEERILTALYRAIR